ALNGNYLETDLSYLILFTYELINYSFNQNAAFNVSMMVRLYEEYKDRMPGCKTYLSDWIHDFLLELDEVGLASEWGFQSTMRSHTLFD
ncbi:TerB N-terminal domain-containing protein, partial [Pseudomonas sp. SIMBA_041]